jgi:F0F1-type ATP synthase membrane subunit c/vacuolar-type H+-ATPase subunit K
MVKLTLQALGTRKRIKNTMILSAIWIHYFAAVLVLLLSGLGLSFGLSWSMDGLFGAVSRQVAAVPQLNKLVMYGMLLIEGSFIMAFIIAISILFPAYSQITLPIALGELGMALAVGCCSCVVGFASAFALHGACSAVARQPFFVSKIQMLTMVVQTLIETPVFFAFIIALLIKIKLVVGLDLVDGMRLLASGATIGLASIGPSVGQLLFTQQCCFAPGINRHAYNKIFTFAVMTEAFIETPILFAFVLSILLLFKKVVLSTIFAAGLFVAMVAGISLGTAGTGLGIGYLAAKSVREIAHDPDNYQALLKLSVLCQIFIETSAIFAFVVVLLLLFRAA